MLQMVVLKNTRHGSWLEDSPRNRENTMMRPLLQLLGTLLLDPSFLLLFHGDGNYTKWM